MSDSPKPERSKQNMIIGISLFFIGMMEIVVDPPFNIAIGGGSSDPVSHIQGVIGGGLLLTVGAIFIYNEIKKR